MNYIVFDLEWNQNPSGKKTRNDRLPFEIIEIGAVKVNSKKVTKERPEGAEKLKSGDFSPLWTPPAAKIPWGKERLRAAKLVTSA